MSARYLYVTPTKAVLLVREPNRAGGGATPALVSVANRPLITHALDWLEEGGIRAVAIVAGDRIAERARDAVGDRSHRSLRTSWLDQFPGERLGESLEALTGFVAQEPFVLHLADSLAEASLQRVIGDADVADSGAMFLMHGSEAALAPVVDIRSGRCTHGGNAAGVAVMGASVLAAVAAVDARPGNELNALADHLRSIGADVEFRSTDVWWRFRDAADTMLEGNRFALQRLRGAPVDAELSDSTIQGEVLIDPSAQLESSTVRGPAVVGPGVRLNSAYVGPFTSVGPNVLVEGAEIENSVILAGASVTHLSARLEGSVIGPCARVFKDFRIPRAMRLNVGRGAEVSVT
jgi:glucose-1-phosphate thymidylyltransferase